MDFKRKRTSTFSQVPWYTNLSLTTIAHMATEALLFPLENLKLRLQVNGNSNYPKFYSMNDCLRQTIKKNGVFGMYRGLGISLLREGIFNASKIMSYEEIKRLFAADVERVGYFRKICPLIGASAIGLTFCNILDIVKIKYICSGGASIQPLLRETFNSVLSSELGNGIIFSGLTLNLIRYSAFLSTEIGVYHQTKLGLIQKGNINSESKGLIWISSIVSSLAACIVTCPIDVMRTRYMSQLGEVNSAQNVGQLALSIIRNESLKTFYKGFVPLLVKTLPSSLLFFTISENMKFAYMKTLSV